MSPSCWRSCPGTNTKGRMTSCVPMARRADDRSERRSRTTAMEAHQISWVSPGSIHVVPLVRVGQGGDKDAGEIIAGEEPRGIARATPHFVSSGSFSQAMPFASFELINNSY